MSSRLRLGLAWALLLAGCAPPPPAPVVPAPVPSAANVNVLALPGGLDDVPVFNSNSPETIGTDGVLLSTFPAHLDQTFEGRFGLFSHHVARMMPGNPRPLHVGLLARNPGSRPVTLTRLAGASALTRPDAPFISLPALVLDPAGTTFAGPGDRVVTERLHDRSNLPAERTTIGPGETRLVNALVLETSVNGQSAANGRSTIAQYQSDGPIYLAEVARYATDERGPGEEDFLATHERGEIAGPKDSEATPMDPNTRPTGAFRYGRVSGVSVGERWQGRLAVSPGPAVGFPIASLYLNRLGTGQIQSAAMRKRAPGTAYQSHGNYGVTYALELALDNPTDAARRYTLTFSHPLKQADEGPARIVYTPGSSQVTYRGTLRLAWEGQTRYYHVVLHNGELPPPFETLTVPPRGKLAAALTLIYPADCTPPQLLTIAS